MKKISILYVTPYFYPAIEFGGPVTASFELANQMKLLGYGVTVLTTDIGGEGKRLKGKHMVSSKIRVIYSKSLLPQIGWKHKLFLSLNQLASACFLVKKFDVIHFQDFFVLNNFFISVMCRFYNKPYIITPHGSFTFKKERGKSVIKKLFYKIFGKYYVNNAAFIHTVSNTERNEIEEEFKIIKSKTIYIPNLILVEDKKNISKINIRKKYGISKSDYIFLFLGRIDTLKGVRELLLGFKLYLIEKKLKNVSLVFAGPDSGSVSYLESKVKIFGLQNKVFFTGLVREDLKNGLIKEASALCLLSFSESLPTVIMEAASFGKPSLFTKECNMESLAKAGGGIITTRSSVSIANSMKKILLKNKSYGKNAKSWFVKNYSPGAILKRYEKIYNKLG